VAARRLAFQGTPELQQFILPDVRPTGRQLGVGSYRSVEVNRLVCAGKRLHDALVEQGDTSVSSISSTYLQECQVMLSIKDCLASLPIPYAYSVVPRPSRTCEEGLSNISSHMGQGRSRI